MIPVYATRDDGWPLCPMCHEDELFSMLRWDGLTDRPPLQAWIDAGLHCYKCGYDSQQVAIRAFEAFHREQWERALRLLNNAPLAGKVQDDSAA